MNSVDAFRYKKELVDALESQKTDGEKLGSRYWYYSLRKKNDKDKDNLKKE